jgi:hypothetical protein
VGDGVGFDVGFDVGVGVGAEELCGCWSGFFPKIDIL